MERSFQVGPDAILDVRIPSGKVEIRRGEPGIIVVRDRGDSEQLIVEQHGATVWVSSEKRSARISKSVYLGVDKSIFLAVEVPDGIDIDINVASADLECGATPERLNVHSASGDIRFNAVGELTARTASGDVHGHSVAGRLGFTSASGDLHVETIGARSELATASGDIRVGGAAGPMSTSTMSGDVEIRRFDGSDFRGKSMSGSVDIGIPAGTSVDLDATTLSGEILLPEPDDSPSSPAGSMDLQVRLVSGDLKVRRV